MTDEELDAMEERANAATPGLWYLLRDREARCEHRPRPENEIAVAMGGRLPNYTTSPYRSSDNRDPLLICSRGELSQGQCEANAVFMSSARQDVPALIEEVRRLRALVPEVSDDK